MLERVHPVISNAPVDHYNTDVPELQHGLYVIQLYIQEDG